MSRKFKPIYFMAMILCTTCSAAPLQAQGVKGRSKQTPLAVCPLPRTEILRTESPSYQGEKPDLLIVRSEKTGIGIKKAYVSMENAGDTTFNVDLRTDSFPEKDVNHLVVKVKDKIFIPYSYGSDGRIYCFLTLKDVDRASAEILHGGILQDAPKDSITVEYLPSQKSYSASANGPVVVGTVSTNVGKTPLTYRYGTTAGVNGRARDTQLSFTATLGGVAVPANPMPLPDGYIGHSHTSDPKSTLTGGVDLTEWLQLDKPGTYHISAVYTIEIMNPKKGAMPSSWKVSYRDHFLINMGN